jgi:hypothetical protein
MVETRTCGLFAYANEERKEQGTKKEGHRRRDRKLDCWWALVGDAFVYSVISSSVEGRNLPEAILESYMASLPSLRTQFKILQDRGLALNVPN